MLRGLARAPGYGFYRMAARETLGVSGWTGQIEPSALTLDPGVWLAGQLSALGAIDDGLRVLDRWALDDPRLVTANSSRAGRAAGANSTPTPSASATAITPDSGSAGLAAANPRLRQLLAAARIAFGAGRWATGIRHARAAFEGLPDSSSARSR